MCRLIGFQLSRLLRKSLPRLWRHFQNVGLSFEVLAAQWMLPLMSITLPFHTLARVWELFFAEVRGASFQVGWLVCIVSHPPCYVWCVRIALLR